MQTESAEEANVLEQAANAFVELRPRLFGIAYRMLGSAAEAEDILQEVWVRWQNTDRATIENPSAFLALITTRLAINVAQSARARRESYIGPWLPEPIDTSIDPAVGAERGEDLELAFLLLLERLTPTERAAYVLREAFVYPYPQIAEILQLSPVNARQLVSRARKHLSAVRREPIDKSEHRQLLEAFLDAAQTGNIGALEDLFAADVVSSSDGGGIRGAARFPLLGTNRVARFLAAFAPRFWPGAEFTWLEVNGRAGVLVPRGRSGVTMLTIEGSPEGIHHVMWIVNPAKLDAFERSRSRGSQLV
ncbi:RNA polymerase sigma-70 factor [Actinopolymorpha pittospori]|uniref:RNA polymerase sigma-70 factor (ECF subfamily) n=1 Tax=Actinopolymorpha pittospori TaxID=648752 RepID=A0A927N426_9ACTN|nr:RNA polymerase sigma-70 factor [Actinopolymorpha pittospori]MBE1612290.1 RNA polymerase sigma-70 factor (ECF subfamily) [Actinopolymorpha pittospori]